MSQTERKFLNLLPEAKAIVVQRLLDDEGMELGEKESILNRIIKGKLARKAYRFWKDNRENVDLDSILERLPSRVRLIAEELLEEQKYDQMAVLLEAAPREVQHDFADWTLQQEIDIVLKNFAQVSNGDRETIRRIMENDGDDELVDRMFSCLLKDNSKKYRDQCDGRRENSTTNWENQTNARVESEVFLARRRTGASEDDFNSDEYERSDDDEEPEFFDSFETQPLTKEEMTRFPDCINILLLGETGVGKTTFINGLNNYLKHRSLKEAVEGGGPEMLIRSVFNYCTSDGLENKITTLPKMQAEDNSEDNEGSKGGETVTKNVRSYWISLGSGDEKKMIRLIDTPGMGDTQNPDERNFEKVVEHLEEIGTLHAVCVLVRSNMSTPALGFRLCIDKLMKHLDKKSTPNVLFCFTHARNTGYAPGDGLPVLNEKLSENTSQNGLSLTANRTNQFSFDQDGLRYLCVVRSGVDIPKDPRAEYERSWAHGVNETRRLLTHIASLPSRRSMLKRTSN